MARRRYVSPNFWEEEQATRLTPCARLLLIGCWTLANDQGLLRWNAPFLREHLFLTDPQVTEAHVSEWMNELVTTNALRPYPGREDKELLGYLVGFETAHKTARPTPSILPVPTWLAPPANDLATGPVSGIERTSTSPAATPVGVPFEGVGVGERATILTESSSAGLTESSSAGLSEDSVSRAVPGSVRTHGENSPPGDAITPSAPADEDNPSLTCTNADSSLSHPEISEPVMSPHCTLITGSPTEREKERELEVEMEPLSASRSCTKPGGATQTPTSLQTAAPNPTKSAFGAGNDKERARDQDRHASTGADGVAETHQKPSSAKTNSTPAENSNDVAPSSPIHEGEAVTPDEAQDSLFVVPDTMVREPATPKRKRAEPKNWTADRKEQTHELLKPWWALYGNGWPQTYGVVFGVIVAAIANNVTPEDIKKALIVLGEERKPISGGTIGFALSRTTKQVAEEKAYEDAASSRSAAKYTRREM